MMTTFKKFAIITIAVLVGIQLKAYNIQGDLERLDKALETSESQERSKEQLLSSLSNMLSYPNTSPAQQVGIYRQIFSECYPYSFDKALAAINSAERIAIGLTQSDLYDVLLDKATLFATAGFFMEAREVMSELDTTKFNINQRTAYHYAMQRYWKDYKDYSDGKQLQRTPMSNRFKYYRDAYIAETPSDAFWHKMLIINNLIDENRFKEAEPLCSALVEKLDSETHEYAIAAYWYGVVCEQLGKTEDKMHWFIESAIADIGNVVKDNASISTIANLLVKDDPERASRYIQISLEDAMAYNAKLRPWQISRLVPAIEMGYKEERSKSEAKIRSYTVGMGILAAILLLITGVLIYALRNAHVSNRRLKEQSAQMKKDEEQLAEAYEKLKTANKMLSDANRAKREYIALFLTMCSGYIDKLKKHISLEEKEAELKNFYNAFDNAFLQLYPDFVEQFNALLKPEERIVLKKDERLTTELRIFALIRLGITQSSHIASLLRYSVNTIYNYRAQVKNAALDTVADFEKSVRNIENHEF